MDEYDPDDHIGPYNGHTPWEPGWGCFGFIALFLLIIAIAIAGHH